MRGMGSMAISKVSFKIEERETSKFELYGFVYAIDLLSNRTLRSLNGKGGKDNLGQKRLSDTTNVEFGTAKDYG